MNKVVLITGGSSGIGKATAEAMRDLGCTVYEGSRRDSSNEGIRHLTLDITAESSCEKAVGEILSREGRIDVLINCAGAGISGAVEFTEAADVQFQLDVNFMGTVNMTKSVLPHMRRQGFGRIVCISSAAAEFPIPFQAYYSATKAAVNAYVCALANEIAPFGISVTSVQPGDIRTGFTSARKKSALGDDIYGGRISRSVAVMERDEQNGIEPEKAGRMIAKIALKKHVKPIFTIGFGYQCLSLANRFLPKALVNRIIGMIYAK